VGRAHGQDRAQARQTALQARQDALRISVEVVERVDQDRKARARIAMAQRSIKLGAGVGLGLPISRQLAELNHGKLILVNEERPGTTATLTLPREEGRAL
jgi:signal transduction histidine kinase